MNDCFINIISSSGDGAINILGTSYSLYICDSTFDECVSTTSWGVFDKNRDIIIKVSIGSKLQLINCYYLT